MSQVTAAPKSGRVVVGSSSSQPPVGRDSRDYKAWLLVLLETGFTRQTVKQWKSRCRRSKKMNADIAAMRREAGVPANWATTPIMAQANTAANNYYQQ
jgi:hypothetical protein